MFKCCPLAVTISTHNYSLHKSVLACKQMEENHYTVSHPRRQQYSQPTPEELAASCVPHIINRFKWYLRLGA
jgi:hypothetical protein